MKILSLSNCPLVESQGSGYIILNFCRGLQQRGHEVDLFGPEYYEPFQSLKKAKRYRQAAGMLLFAAYQLTKKKYDVIEFYGGESWLTASIIAKIPKRSSLLVSHSNGLETYYNELLMKYLNSPYSNGAHRKWYQLNQKKLLEKAFTQVDGIVTLSEYECNYGLKHQYKNNSHIVAIEPSLLNDYLGLAIDFQRKPIIGYCGSWLQRKGSKLIEADISRLLTDFPECSFKLVGVGDSFRKSTHFPSALCSRIEVIPFVKSKKELQNIYQMLSILIVPSIYESFGLVTSEAMACGCAVVVSKTGFGASLKHREEAVIIQEPVSPFLYEGVKELLLNEPLRLQIAKTGYQRVQNLCWEAAVEQLESIYLEWLNELRQKHKY
jgi:glycosyltransferase involved in cell wall biosynthesis